MFNPLKLNQVEKRVLLGGLASSLTFWGDRTAMHFVAGYPEVLKQQIDPHLPQNGDIVSSVAPPAALYLVQRVVKSAETKEKMGDLAFGSALYSFPNLVRATGVRTLYAEGSAARSAARLTAPIPVTTAKYAQTATPARVTATPSVGKYRLTA